MRSLFREAPAFLKLFHGSGKISARFRNINIALFAAISIIIAAIMFSVLQNITDAVSKDYAKLYSANAVGTLNAYLGSEIALLKKAANSNAVMDWFDDEDNQEKKRIAYGEMMGVIRSLSSNHLYMGIEKSLHEYTVEEHFTIDDIVPVATLDAAYFDDAWYFECAASDKDYLLNVDIDKVFQRKLVWLNYKVSRDDSVLGVLCTGLEFSKLVESLFSEYDNKNVRGLVMDENGIIHMDSTRLGDDDFLYYTLGGEYHIEDEFTDAAFLSAAGEYIKDIDGYFDLESATVVIPLSTGQYRYATIAPIALTTWSVITFYDSSSLFHISKFMPLFIAIPAAFVFFIAITGFASIKLLFAPFEKLMSSVGRIKTNMNERVYGTDRNDEIGELANTVQDMKDSLLDMFGKVHYDALTGIYNRRFLEENISRVMKSLSRSGGKLSVLMVDVDFFKNFNDTYGHSAGDICLKTIAAALAGSMARADDFAARYGGEEFAVVLPNTDENGACLMAERLLENVRACNILHEQNRAANYVTVSIGVTTGSVDYTQSGEEYIERADEALYDSKQNGRNRYTLYEFHKEAKGPA